MAFMLKVSNHKHYYIRKACRMAVENEMVANPRTMQDLKLGTVFTSEKPHINWLRFPFAKVKLESQQLTLAQIADECPENAAKLQALEAVFSDAERNEKRNVKKEDILLEDEYQGSANFSASSHGSVKGEVDIKTHIRVDFGCFTKTMVDPQSFHDAMKGLMVDYGRWGELKIRNPQSLYVVVCLESSDKLKCERVVTGNVEGDAGITGIPMIDAHVGARRACHSELHFERDTRGVIGFKIARLHIDRTPMTASLVKFDFSIRGRVNRLDTDGAHDEFLEIVQALEDVGKSKELQEVLERWNANPPSAATVDCIEELVHNVLSAGAADAKVLSLPIPCAPVDESGGDGCSPITDLLRVLGVRASVTDEVEVTFDWSDMSDAQLSLLPAVPGLVALAQERLLGVCRIASADVDCVAQLLDTAASATVPDFERDEDQKLVSFTLENMPAISDSTVAELSSVGITVSAPLSQYSYGRLRPATLLLLASFVGVFNA